MEIIAVLFSVFIVVILFICLVQSWKPSKRMTDEELYGCSAELYGLKMMGKEIFIEYYGEDKYKECLEEERIIKSRE